MTIDQLGARNAFAAFHEDESGAATAEYAIALIAAAGFAGLLVTILTSDTARGWLTNLIEQALSR
jgi:Flp pilus assembly pilin Flp